VEYGGGHCREDSKTTSRGGYVKPNYQEQSKADSQESLGVSALFCRLGLFAKTFDVGFGLI
jgi:hypothetical protein